MRRFNRIIGGIAGAVMLLSQIPVFANSGPDYLQFPYFDDFESYEPFTATAQVGNVTEDAAPVMTGELPEAYDGTTITRMNNSSRCGTIELYDDGVEKMIKSTRNYTSSLNLDIGEFEPGLLSEKFTMEMRVKLEHTVPGEGSNVPRIYGQIAKSESSGTTGTDVNDTIKLFFLVNGIVRIPNNSSATGSSILQDPETGTDYVMDPNKWYTLRCEYDFSSSSNNLTLTLMGTRGDGRKIEASRTTTLYLENEYDPEDLTRFRISHFGSDPSANTQSVAYYKDISFYTDVERTMTLPFTDDMESYEPFEAQAQLMNAASNTDYPPVMNFGTLPGSYSNSSLTPSLTDANRGFIELAQEDDGNKYLRIRRVNSWGRNNIDIGPFEKGVLSENKISARFRAKFGEPGETDFPGIMVMLSSTGAGNDTDDLNSIPMLYVYPDRVITFKGPMNKLTESLDNPDTVYIRDSSDRIVMGSWYQFSIELDYEAQQMTVAITDEDSGRTSEVTLDSIPCCPSETFSADELTTFRIRADRRGSREYDLTAGFDDIAVEIVPKFKISSDINGQTGVSPADTQTIDVSFPQIQADPESVAAAEIYSSPYIEGLNIGGVSSEGFTIDLSGAGVLEANTQYTITIDGITDLDGNALSGNKIVFTTGEAEKYIIYNDTLSFSGSSGELSALVPGDVRFSLEAGNYSLDPISFAMGLYRREQDGYDTMIDYTEQILPAGSRECIESSFTVPSGGEHYIKGYFLSSPLASIAQDLVFDGTGMHFTDRSEFVYEKIAYGSENVEANTDLDSVGNICDGDFSTCWEAGADGYITVDMGETADIDFVQLAVYMPENAAANYLYDIQVSEDGSNFTTVASGNTLNRENLKFIQKRFDRTAARYVRIAADPSSPQPLRLTWVGLYKAADNQFWSF